MMAINLTRRETAVAQVETLAILRATFKEGKRSVEGAQQTILSLDKAMYWLKRMLLTPEKKSNIRESS